MAAYKGKAVRETVTRRTSQKGSRGITRGSPKTKTPNKSRAVRTAKKKTVYGLPRSKQPSQEQRDIRTRGIMAKPSAMADRPAWNEANAGWDTYKGKRQYTGSPIQQGANSIDERKMNKVKMKKNRKRL